MEQHPVPQHIASFEFKLFGNLTVRQFVTLIIPVGFAATIYFSPLPFIIRITTTIIIGLFGLFAALVPIGGRPFDKWVVAFIKAVLSPTQRIWIKEKRIPDFLSVVTQGPKKEEKVPEVITAQGRERLKNYLRSLPKGNIAPLDVKEQIAVQRLGLEPFIGTVGSPYETKALEGSLPPPIIWPISPVSMAQIPPSQWEGKLEESLPNVTPTHQQAHTKKTPKLSSHAKPFALPGLEKKLTRGEKPQEETIEIAPTGLKAQLASEANFTIENVIPIKTPGKKIKLIHGISKTRARKLHFAPPDGFDLSKLPIRGERRFEISEELKKRFSQPDGLFAEVGETPQPQTILQKTVRALTPKQTHLSQKPNVSAQKPLGVSQKVEQKEVLDSKFSIKKRTLGHIAPTSKLSPAQIVPLTNIPNVISGIVTQKDQTPLERVILVVKDTYGIPVRALKTSKLGQFLSATPLANGTYTIEIESDSHRFKPISVNLTGQTLAPMEIRAET